MSEKLPGAEYAPIIVWTGARHIPADAEAIGALRLAEAMASGIGWARCSTGFVRRLSCTDADDQRAIWRRAALALGHGAEVALYAVLVRAKGALRTSDGRAMWSLYDWDGHRFAFVWVDEDTVEAATAALCARVWGPK